jgi:phosphodiesterase/alkaline phosphatase D-like protein
MVFTGDADWKWKPYPILASLAQENADFFLFLGDLLYESTNYAGKSVVEGLSGYRFKYRENREPRANSASGMLPMRDLYAAFGQYSVFDNHETGMSMADRDAPAVADPSTLVKDDAEREYENRRAEETFSFTVRAQ